MPTLWTESPYSMAAVGLLILTGARLMEILTLRWEYVDFENDVLRLPDSKTGAKLIHLNGPAIKLLRALPRMGANPHVIAGTKDRAPLVNLQKPWRRICAKAGLTDVRLHDLRHSFASVAVGSGMSLPMIGKLLGHTQPGTTARYAHLAVDPIRAASNLIGSEIAAVMNGATPALTRHRSGPARKSVTLLSALSAPTARFGPCPVSRPLASTRRRRQATTSPTNGILATSGRRRLLTQPVVQIVQPKRSPPMP